MTNGRIYLDWNATAPLRPEARDAMVAALGMIGNPSSVHAEGRAAHALIERARDQVAALVGARPQDVVFTSGATEANNWVVRGGWDTILRAGSEHDSVIAPAGSCGARIVELPVLSDGVVGIQAIADETLRGKVPLDRALVALQLVNNETGVIQDVETAVEFCRGHGLCTLIDAVQGAGRIRLDVARLGADYVTLSAHKLGGPQGVGALIMQAHAPLPALILGGGQERRQRAGTENVAAIAGFGAAAEAAGREQEVMAARIAAKRDRLEHGIRALTPQAMMIGAGASRIANTSCVALRGRRAEVLVAALDLAGVAVSAGAACSSGKVGRSPTLEAMGLPPDIADGAVRVSLGWTTTDDDIAAFLAAWQTLSTQRQRAA